MSAEIVAVRRTATPDPAGAGATAAADAALRRPRSWPEWLGAAAVPSAAVLAAWPTLTGALGWSPACLVRQHLGVPCPFCGGIRAGRALLGVDVATALAANPLVVALLGASVVMLAVWLLRIAGVLHGPQRWSTATSRRAGLAALAALVLSWSYQLHAHGALA